MAIYFRGQKIASGTDKSGVVPSGLVTKTTIGLGNVDNTSDLNKPLSTATINALAGKQNTILNAPKKDQVLMSSNTSGGLKWGLPDTLSYLTQAPNSANTEGLKIVVLNSEPLVRYSGYIYIITIND